MVQSIVKLLALNLWITHKLKYLLPFLSKIHFFLYFLFGRRHNRNINNIIYRFIELAIITSWGCTISWSLLTSRWRNWTCGTTENSRSLLGFVYKTIDYTNSMRVTTAKPYLIKSIHPHTFLSWAHVNLNTFFQSQGLFLNLFIFRLIYWLYWIIT